MITNNCGSDVICGTNGSAAASVRNICICTKGLMREDAVCEGALHTAQTNVESRQEFSALLDVLSCTFYRCEVLAPWRLTFVSQDVAKLTGYQPAEFEKMAWEEIIHPDDVPHVHSAVAEAIKHRQPFRIAYRIVQRSGDLRHVREQGHAIYGPEGEPQYLEGMITDITEEQDLRKISADALQSARSSTDQLLKVLEATSDCIYSINREWRFSFLNERAKSEIAGNVDLRGCHILDAFPQVEELPLWRDFQKAMRGEASGRIESYVPGLDHWYEGQIFPTDDGITVFFRNVDERKAAENESRNREERLMRTLAHVPQMIWSTRPDGFHDYYSPLWYEFTGVPIGSTDGEAWNGVFHPDDQERAKIAWQHSLRTGEPYKTEYRLRHHSGEYRWVLGRANPERNERGEVIRWYGTCTDIHDGINALHAWGETRTLQESILDASADCIKLIKLDGTIAFMNNPGLRSMEIKSLDMVRGKAWTSLWPLGTRPEVLEAVKVALSGKVSRFSGFCPTASGKPKWWDVVVSPVRNMQGEIDRLLSISRDITEQRETAQQLKRASEEDSLTKLPNRRAFESRLRAATIRAMRSGGQVAVLLVDLDHFKHINDTLGHPAGDHVLAVFAQRLKDVTRSSDFVARLGGDEFAIILESPDGNIDPHQIGAQMVDRMKQPIWYEGQHISAGASIGGAIFPDSSSNANDLLKNADIALYALKESGRGGTLMFKNEMLEHTESVASQLSLARSLLTEISIEPHYQPKVSLATGQVAGFEALLRWNHGTRGIQQPHTVAEAFKDYELAVKIGEIMQDKVFRDARSWLGRKLPVGFIAINAAPAEFLRDDFAEKFLSRLTENSIPPSLVEIEVTEHVFLQRGADYVGRALDVLNKAGVRIALDDFGTGHSSLTHLRDYPVDVLKIDRSFVDRMTTDDEVSAIVSAVIRLAKSLKIDVVAEGIESELQRQLLVKEGCKLGQGFYFSRAVRALGTTEQPLMHCSYCKPLALAMGILRRNASTRTLWGHSAVSSRWPLDNLPVVRPTHAGMSPLAAGGPKIASPLRAQLRPSQAERLVYTESIYHRPARCWFRRNKRARISSSVSAPARQSSPQP